MISLFKRRLKQVNIIKFVVWLYGEFKRHDMTSYSPDQFKFFGQGAIIDENVQINIPSRVILKDYSVIGGGTVINSQGGLYVGKYSGIGYNCIIWTVEHNYRKAGYIPFGDGADLKPVVIRDFVWIGSNVKITPGREIGEGAIIGLGAVVTRDIPALSIVMGNPARIVGWRDKKDFEQCKSEGKFHELRFVNYKEKLFSFYKKKFRDELIELEMLDF